MIQSPDRDAAAQRERDAAAAQERKEARARRDAKTMGRGFDNKPTSSTPGRFGPVQLLTAEDSANKFLKQMAMALGYGGDITPSLEGEDAKALKRNINKKLDSKDAGFRGMNLLQIAVLTRSLSTLRWLHSNKDDLKVKVDRRVNKDINVNSLKVNGITISGQSEGEVLTPLMLFALSVNPALTDSKKQDAEKDFLSLLMDMEITIGLRSKTDVAGRMASRILGDVFDTHDEVNGLRNNFYKYLDGVINKRIKHGRKDPIAKEQGEETTTQQQFKKEDKMSQQDKKTVELEAAAAARAAAKAELVAEQGGAATTTTAEAESTTPVSSPRRKHKSRKSTPKKNDVAAAAADVDQSAEIARLTELLEISKAALKDSQTKASTTEEALTAAKNELTTANAEHKEGMEKANKLLGTRGEELASAKVELDKRPTAAQLTAANNSIEELELAATAAARDNVSKVFHQKIVDGVTARVEAVREERDARVNMARAEHEASVAAAKVAGADSRNDEVAALSARVDMTPEAYREAVAAAKVAGADSRNDEVAALSARVDMTPREYELAIAGARSAGFTAGQASVAGARAAPVAPVAPVASKGWQETASDKWNSVCASTSTSLSALLHTVTRGKYGTAAAVVAPAAVTPIDVGKGYSLLAKTAMGVFGATALCSATLGATYKFKPELLEQAMNSRVAGMIARNGGSKFVDMLASARDGAMNMTGMGK